MEGESDVVVLVTGATGLIGTNLVNKLKSMGHDVYGQSISRRTLDLRETKKVAEYINKLAPEIVYHLAANCAEGRGQISPIDMSENNLNIFLNVLVPAINNGVRRFVYVSSVAVYGEAKTPYKEDGPTVPEDVYGVNKLACEQILKIMSKVYGFDYTIFRPHNVYGPHMDLNNPYKNVVGLFMRKLMEGKPYQLRAGGEMRRAFSYVDDVVDVLSAGLSDKFKGQTVNVGSDRDISIKELSDILQRVVGIKGNVEITPAKPQEITMFLADHTLQNSLVEYGETPLEEGLGKTWDWVKKKELGEFEVQSNEINV